MINLKQISCACEPRYYTKDRYVCHTRSNYITMSIVPRPLVGVQRDAVYALITTL